MKVCYFGTYRAQYVRNRKMIESLRRSGVEVIECHVPLWRSIEDRVHAVSQGWKHPAFWWRVARVYARLIWQYWTLRADYDVMMIGYPGHFDVFLGWLLTRVRRRPLVWDILMSIYLVAYERGLEDKSPFMVGWIQRLERWACRLPDLLIQDTVPYVEWFGKTHGVAPERFRLLPLGADSDRFRPTIQVADGERRRDEPFRVLYYGTFLANHSVLTIVEAARLLQDTPQIHMEFIGEGPEREAAQTTAREWGLHNVTFLPWMTPEELRSRMEAAHLCLGSFGVTPQSYMTIHNKVYEGMAMRRPVLTGDGPAVRAAFEHEENIYLCERGNAAALAVAIRALQADPRLCAHIAGRGYRTFQAEYTIEKLGARLAGYLREVANRVGER
jgi:glycosyltransferase involved in cell wall biosynthesis